MRVNTYGCPCAGGQSRDSRAIVARSGTDAHGRVVRAPYVRPRRALDEARAADGRARDHLAAALDELLPGAPLMRTVGARLLTRAVAKSDGANVVAIARELGSEANALSTRIYRAGGASIRELRREMIVTRLAAIVEDPGLPWPLVAELLGVPRAQTLLDLIRSGTNLPAGLWRERIRFAAQLEQFRRFLRANAAAWSRLPRPGARAVERRAGHGVELASVVRPAP